MCRQAREAARKAELEAKRQAEEAARKAAEEIQKAEVQRIIQEIWGAVRAGTVGQLTQQIPDLQASNEVC